MPPEAQDTPEFASYGSILTECRKERDLPEEVVASEMGISLEELRALERGDREPPRHLLNHFARFYHVNERDLMPARSVEDVITTQRYQDSRKTYEADQQTGKTLATIRHLVQSRHFPHIIPTEIQPHDADKDRAISRMNARKSHTFFYTLEGPVGLVWEHKGSVYEQTLEKGTSGIIPAMVRYQVHALLNEADGKFLRVGFGQNFMSRDVREEMRAIGADQISRLAEDGDYANFYVKPNIPETTGSPQYREYGHLIRHWQNETKLTPQHVKEQAGIDPLRFELLKGGFVKPDDAEIQGLAITFGISPRELMPRVSDLDRGITIQTLEQAPSVPQNRNGLHAYDYRIHARTRLIPHFMPVSLVMRMTREQALERSNNGHKEHSFVYALRGKTGSLSGRGNATLEDVLQQGDTTLTRGFTPHVFWHLPDEEEGEILSMTFAQYLTGDAIEEARLIGSSNLKYYAE